MRRTRTASFFAILLGISGHAYSQAWSGILSPGRAIDWSGAGVTGGIPSGSWTQCGSTIAAYGSSSSPASPATINNAIAACGANTYVQLGAGTFYLNSGLLVSSQNNIAIRGMGANQTFLVFSGQNPCQGAYTAVCFQSSDINWNDGPSNGPINWTASSYAQGSTSITLASVPNLAVGNPIILDQLDSTIDIGSILEASNTTGGNPYTSPGSPGPYSLQGENGARPGRGQLQIVTVASCNGVSTPGTACSGANVAATISPGLHMPNWCNDGAPCTGTVPQAWWATHPILNVGVENLSINATNDGAGPGNGTGVEFFNALNGWVKGVQTIGTSRAGVQAYYSAHVTVRDSYFYLAVNSASTSYGVECYSSTDPLVENNIFQAIAGPLTINGSCEGAVLGYNYAVLGYYTQSSGWSMPMSNSHGINTDYVLWEGNIGSQINEDVFHGTHNMDTIFRNYMAGTYPACWISGSTYSTSVYGACTSNPVPIDLLAFSRFSNIIGNVLGTSGIQTGYTTGIPIYILGSGDTDGTVTVPNDPVSQSSVMLWGNYDVVTKAVRWCGNSSDPGWTTICGSISELPSTYMYYPNAVPASTTLPSSFYYSSKPSWWPISKPWPLIGPDVSGGNISGVGGYAYTNPAEDCYTNVMGGPSNGTGGPLSFNAATCYGTTAGPAAPTSLQIVVQ